MYQLATYKGATIREHVAHGSPIHTRKLDPWRPGGDPLDSPKRAVFNRLLFSNQAANPNSCTKNTFLSSSNKQKKHTYPPEINTPETVGGLQGGP